MDKIELYRERLPKRIQVGDYVKQKEQEKREDEEFFQEGKSSAFRGIVVDIEVGVELTCPKTGDVCYVNFYTVLSDTNGSRRFFESSLRKLKAPKK